MRATRPRASAPTLIPPRAPNKAQEVDGAPVDGSHAGIAAHSMLALTVRLLVSFLLLVLAPPAAAQFISPNCAGLSSSLVQTGTMCSDTTRLNALFYDGTSWRSSAGLAFGYAVVSDPRWGATTTASDNTAAFQAAFNSNLCVVVPLVSGAGFKVVGPITLPVTGACMIGFGYNGALASTITHTGSGDLFQQNVGGILSNTGNSFRGLNILGTPAVSVNAFRLERIVNAGTWADMSINDFSNGGAAFKTTGVNGGVDDLTLINVFMQHNSACVWTASTGSDSNSHWRVIGGQCQGQVAQGGRNAAWDFGTATVQDLLMLGVDTNFNATPRDMYFGGVVTKVAFLGGNFNPNGVATDGIVFDTTATPTAITISSFFYHSAAAATGRAIWFKTACTGCKVTGNTVKFFAAAGNSAIDPGGNAMIDSDFCCNAITGAGTKYGTFGAGSGPTYPAGTLLGVGTTTTTDGSAGAQLPGIALPNARYLAVESAAGGVIYPAIGLNASNQLLVDPQGLGVFFIGSGLVLGTGVTGNDKGLGTINVKTAYYLNGTIGVTGTATVCSAGACTSTCTLIFTGGIRTGGTC